MWGAGQQGPGEPGRGPEETRAPDPRELGGAGGSGRFGGGGRDWGQGGAGDLRELEGAGEPTGARG